MINNLIITSQFVNNNLVVRYSNKESIKNELLVKQKIAKLTKEIFLLVEKDSPNTTIKQVNFIFKNDKVKIVIKNDKGNFEYNLTTDENIFKRAKELVVLVNKTKKITTIFKKNSELKSETDPLSQQQDTVSSTSLSKMISKIYRSIERWYTLTYTLNPSLNQSTTSFFNEIKNEKDLKEKWKTSQQFLSSQVDDLYQQLNLNRTDELFSKEELFALVSQKLEQSFISHFLKLTKTPLSKSEMQILRNERKLLEAISRLERGGDEEEVKENEKFWSETVDTIPAIEFPIEQLAQIKLNIQTEKYLINTWDRILKELVDKGNLNKLLDVRKNPVEGTQQVRFADAYVHACQLIPGEFRDIFHQFHILNTNRLEKFIRAQPNALELKSLSQDKLGEIREMILKECIRPIIDQKQTKFLNDHKDFIPIVNMIANPQSQALMDMVNEIEKKIEENLKNASIPVSEKQKLGLTRDKVIDFVIFDFEQFGIEHYSISNEQILHLRQKKESLAIKSQQMKQIKHQVNECEDLAEKIHKTEKRLNLTLKNPSFLKNGQPLSPENVALLKDYLNKIESRIKYLEIQIAAKDQDLLINREFRNEFQLVKEGLEKILNHPYLPKDAEKIFDFLTQQQQLTNNFQTISNEIFENTPILEFPIEIFNQSSITQFNQHIMIDLWSTLLKKMDAIRKDDTQPYDVKGEANFKFRVIKRLLLDISSPDEFKYQIAKEFERLEKPTDLTKEIIDRLNQETNLEKWKEEIQSIKPSNIHFELLAAMPITQTNTDFALALWAHLMNESINPIEKEFERIQSSLFVKNPDVKNVKKFEELLFNYRNLVQILKDVSNPLIITHIQSLQNDAKKIVTQKIQTQIITAGKALFPLAKAIEMTDAELLMGNIQQAPSLSIQSKASQKELSGFEIQGLQLLTKALASLEQRNETLLSNEENKQLEDFIDLARKPGPYRKALNAKLREITQGKQIGMAQMIKESLFSEAEDNRLYKHIPFGISASAVEVVLGVTHQLRNSDQFELLAIKLRNLLNKIDSGEDIHPSDQMTIKELGILAKCAKIGDDKKGKSLLTKLQEIVADEKENPFTNFSETSKQAQQLFDRLNKKFKEQCTYKDGDFVAKIGAKEHEFYGHTATPMEQLHFNLVTPFSHGAKIYIERKQSTSNPKVETKKTKLSEILGGYNQNDYEFYADMISQVWRLDISKMIPQEKQKFLIQVYGENWPQILQEKYESIENKIHRNENKQFNEITNLSERRFEAGKADYIWGGHVKKGETDFQYLAKRMLGEKEIKKEEYFKEMICSEFVTQSSLTALVKLNEQISQGIDAWNSRPENKTKIENDENMLEIPISKHEELSRVHPGRMIELFKRKNCIRQLKASEKPKIVQQIIRAA